MSSSNSGKYRFNGFSSRLWIRISSPSRNTNARNPSHFGSKIHDPPVGNSATLFASIGKTGGFTGRCTPQSNPFSRMYKTAVAIRTDSSESDLMDIIPCEPETHSVKLVALQGMSLAECLALLWMRRTTYAYETEGCAMTIHVVQQGEHLSGIAHKYRFRDYQTIWNDAQNEALRKKRRNPHVLYPGDRVYIPEKLMQSTPVSTGQVHRFRLNVKPLKLRLAVEDWN